MQPTEDRPIVSDSSSGPATATFEPIQQSTSILELMYLIRAKNKGEMSFAEWLECASSWAEGVIAEYETEQGDTAPSISPIQSAQGGDEDGCQSRQ